MKSLNYYTAILIIAFTTACGNAAEQGYTTDPVKPTATDTSKTLQAIQPQTTQPQAVQPQATAPASTGNTALNPAHGQPGHRCDISVGAPLNSKPASTTTTNQTQQIQSMTKPAPAPVSAPVSTGGGAKNPAHGQPGHRCDIAVGAPLN